MSAPDHHRQFEALTGPYRRELRVHCYRMLGSLQDAEDLVQETWLRAWKSFARFEGTAVRAWLYRIATHACLNALESRQRRGRLLPEQLAPPALDPALGPPSPEVAWLEPIPEALLNGVVDDTPHSHALRAESVRLAFLSALQLLPPRQRAAVLLCEVLGWSAAEAAAHLEASAAAVNSALQRARETLAQARATDDLERLAPAGQEALLERYLHSWQSHDLDGFVRLLAEDATFSMPPWGQWYAGRDAIRAFFARAWQSCHGLRLRRTSANGCPAFAVSERDTGGQWQAHSLHVLELRGGAIGRLTTWVPPLGPRLLERFVDADDERSPRSVLV
jgi:RNA polymerase sigma-70 factor (ECF subfamily)